MHTLQKICRLRWTLKEVLLLGAALLIAGCGKSEPAANNSKTEAEGNAPADTKQPAAVDSNNKQPPPVSADAEAKQKLKKMMLEQIQIYETLSDLVENLKSAKDYKDSNEYKSEKEKIANLEMKVETLKKEFLALPAETKQHLDKGLQREWNLNVTRYQITKERARARSK